VREPACSEGIAERLEPSPVYFHQKLHPCLPLGSALPDTWLKQTDSTLKGGERTVNKSMSTCMGESGFFPPGPDRYADRIPCARSARETLSGNAFGKLALGNKLADREGTSMRLIATHRFCRNACFRQLTKHQRVERGGVTLWKSLPEVPVGARGAG
jgi:hypothetical protein